MNVPSKLICLIMLFTSLAIYNQVDNGSYTSNKTSYQDEINGANNFMELTRNNIFIDVSRDGKKGVFVFQDPRIPEKILSYGVISSEVYQSEQQTIYIYNCEVLHLPDQPETDIIIYWNKQGGMNIMVKDEYSSQVFHSLKWVE